MIGHVVLSFSTGADRRYHHQYRVLSVHAGEQAPIFEFIISIEGSSQPCLLSLLLSQEIPDSMMRVEPSVDWIFGNQAKLARSGLETWSGLFSIIIGDK